MVGSIRADKEELYGGLLAKYLADPTNLFIISSDFCHWGMRFSYTYYRPERGAEAVQLTRTMAHLDKPIHASISDLDHEGMELIESLDFEQFALYLARTKNTICGRHPIGVLLAAMAVLREEEPQQRQRIKFVKYAQSSACESVRDSSVSYASAFVCIEWKRDDSKVYEEEEGEEDWSEKRMERVPRYTSINTGRSFGKRCCYKTWVTEMKHKRFTCLKYDNHVWLVLDQNGHIRLDLPKWNTLVDHDIFDF